MSCSKPTQTNCVQYCQVPFISAELVARRQLVQVPVCCFHHVLQRRILCAKASKGWVPLSSWLLLLLLSLGRPPPPLLLPLLLLLLLIRLLTRGWPSSRLGGMLQGCGCRFSSQGPHLKLFVPTPECPAVHDCTDCLLSAVNRAVALLYNTVMREVLPGSLHRSCALETPPVLHLAYLLAHHT